MRAVKFAPQASRGPTLRCSRSVLRLWAEEPPLVLMEEFLGPWQRYFLLLRSALRVLLRLISRQS